MIRINLCPLDELESQYWYVPDAAVLLTVALASFFGVQYYLGTIKDQIDAKHEAAEGLKKSYEMLAPDLQRFANLSTNMDELNKKLAALKSITVSKISKYKPIIVIEHLQNLRPEGLWYKSASISPDYHFELRGQAFDALLVGELMATMKATASQEPDESDLRTEVYFDQVTLEETGSQGAIPTGAAAGPGAPSPNASTAGEGFTELAGFPEFRISGQIVDRKVEAKTEGNKGIGAPVSLESGSDLKRF